MHDEWPDNLFLKTEMDKGIAEAAARAAVTVRRQYRMARQVMNPMEGKAVLAHWDERLNQLVVYTSTQVPHMIRTAVAEHLGLPQGSVRVIAPDVGGAFGYKCVLQPEELCIAWLAMKFRRPFRWVEDRREHLISGANCREHFYDITAYADERGAILGLDAEITVDAGAYSVWPFTIVPRRHDGRPTLARSVRIWGLSRSHIQCRHQQTSHCALPRRCANRHLVCHGINGRRHCPCRRSASRGK